MKILIWFACAFVYSIIVTGLSASGIMLGGIPTVCLLGCTFFAGRYFCKEYDTQKKDRQSKPVPTKFAESLSEVTPPKVPQGSVSKPTKVNPEKSTANASISDSYKKPYIIALIVAACLFLTCTVLGLRYYYDTLEMKQAIADYQESIQQIETDLKSANDDLKYKDAHIQTIKKNAEERYVYFYNEGICDGYIEGYNAAAKLKGKAKTVDKFDFLEEYELYKNIAEFYREYDE